MPHFEVYILNYNGAHFLPACLTSLQNLELGSHTLGINVVDNASHDSSKTLVESEFPDVRFVALDKNYGFSKGNNLGVSKVQEILDRQNKKIDVHVFLNNDTSVERDWLLEAARVFEKSKKAGIVGSKSLFYDRFVEVTISSKAPFRPADFEGSDSRTLGVFLRKLPYGSGVVTDPRRMKVFGCYHQEHDGRWTAEKTRILVPVLSEQFRGQMEIENRHPNLEVVEVGIQVNGNHSVPVLLKRGEPRTVEIESDTAADVIQNAGSFVNSEWNAGDRGMFEIDRGQYENEEKLSSICGVSLFIKDEVWKKIRGFDPRFFSYFEDVDLSLRTQLAGYDCMYCPKSVLRHVHCGSGGEYSDYFNSTVAFSHLFFGSRYMSRRQWRAHLAQVRAQALEQFLVFERDRNIINKPQLRAYGKYIKSWHAFLLNRIMQPWRGKRLAGVV